MAEEKFKEETPKNQHPKIDCKCRRSVLSLLQTVDRYVANIVSSDPTVRTITETYKTALMSNILIEGKSVKDDPDLDTTTEFEPYDTSKEHFIEHVLMDRFDRQIVNTSRYRKTGSKQVRRKLKNIIRPELKYSALVSVKFQSDTGINTETQSGCGDAIETQSSEMETDAPVCHNETSFAEAQARLRASAEKSVYVRQNCDDMIQKSRDLSQALHVFKQSEKSDIMKALYETPPHTPTDTSDKLMFNKDFLTKNISKKLMI